MPLPAPDPDEAMPENLQAMARAMRQQYMEVGDWWESSGIEHLQPPALPADLLDDFRQMTANDVDAAA